jgi:hypothetical protein
MLFPLILVALVTASAAVLLLQYWSGALDDAAPAEADTLPATDETAPAELKAA